MKKILLICSGGMSTSLLSTKMSNAAAKKGIEVSISAVAEADVKNNIDDVDVLLLGPQVRYLLPKVKELLGSKEVPVDIINGIHYGTMNGEAVLDHALKMIKGD
ncbi:PTS sugar transporter subunit IIB [Brassicibacter mesophilus]|uniref:PTS sugar transporter subunit IIB n=1 Tax=Brassicibacter mesophilus TaxID=745119 RepID=UPI003D24A49A